MQQEEATLTSEAGFASESVVRPGERESWIFDLLVVLARHKVLIFVVTLSMVTLAAIRVSFMRDVFRAEAVIMLPQQQQSALAAFSSSPLGALGSSGLAAQLGLRNPGDLYVGILKSQTVSDAIIEQFQLQRIYKRRFLSDARRDLSRHATFVSGKDSLIVISVDDYDPKRAASLANAFVDQLYSQNSRLAMTDASQRRAFFEHRLGEEKDALSEAEVEMQKAQRSSGLVLPSGQADVLLHSTAQMRAGISSREVELQAIRSYATDENTQVQTLKSELAALRVQLNQLETAGGPSSSFEVSVGKLPTASLEYIRRLRDVKYHETLYELLAKQYEAAQLDEAKQAPLIQIVDHAMPPDKKSGPPRLQIVVGLGLLATVLTCAAVYLAHSVKAQLMDPAQAPKIATLRAAMRLGVTARRR